MPNPFDWDVLTTAPSSGDILQPFAVIYALVFLGGFVLACYLYYRPWTPPIGRLYRRTWVIKAMNLAMWICGIGSFFFLIRLLQIDPLTLGRPIWMWLSVIALVALLAWFVLASPAARKSSDEAIAARYGPRRRQPVQRNEQRPVRRNNSSR